MANTCKYCGKQLTESDKEFCSKECQYKDYTGQYLTMTLKEKWFQMILSGEKKEEYRDRKHYWTVRFEKYFGRHYERIDDIEIPVWNTEEKIIRFRNGYDKNSPEFLAKCTIKEGYGNPDWGASPGIYYYILTIHKIFAEKNIV